MNTKVEIFTFSIIDKSNENVKINFQEKTLDEIFEFIKSKFTEHVNMFPPTANHITYKLNTYVDQKSETTRTHFKFSKKKYRFDGIISIGSGSDEILNFTEATKDKKSGGKKEKGLNIDKNHYFQIIFNKDSDTGFLILEKNPNSIKKDFTTIFESLINKKYSSGVKLEVKNFIENDLYENHLKKGKYFSITCSRKGIKNQNTKGITSYVDQGEFRIETKLKTNNGFTKTLKNKVKEAYDNKKSFFEIPEFEELNYTEDNNSILKIDTEYNGKKRTIDLSNVGKVKPVYDIEDINETEEGSSDYFSISREVNELLKELDIGLY